MTLLSVKLVGVGIFHGDNQHRFFPLLLFYSRFAVLQKKQHHNYPKRIHMKYDPLRKSFAHTNTEQSNTHTRHVYDRIVSIEFTHRRKWHAV